MDIWIWYENSSTPTFANVITENEIIPTVEDTFRTDVLKMLDNPSFYPDFIFKVGEKTIRAHKCLIASRSAYFDTYVHPAFVYLSNHQSRLFKSGLKEAVANELTIEEDIKEEVFMALLKYLYLPRGCLVEIIWLH